MLTGSDLLAKVKELGDVSKSELVRACGYFSTKKNGGERLNFTAFYEALLEAKGVNLGDSGAAGIGKGGRKLSYIAKNLIKIEQKWLNNIKNDFLETKQTPPYNQLDIDSLVTQINQDTSE